MTIAAPTEGVDVLSAGVDVGGTFTDVVLFDSRRNTLEVAKVPSTPSDQSLGVLEGLGAVLEDLAALGKLVHGTTVSTNAMLEKSGARVALVTSAGFADVLEIGRTRRMLPSLFHARFVRPAPLVPRPLRFEVGERLAPDGSVLEPLDSAGLEKIAGRLREVRAEAVAICFLHAYADPRHEESAKRILEHALPDVKFTFSAEVVSEFREYERFSTTVVNAYLLPVMERYLSSLNTRLAAGGYRSGFHTMSSAGGVLDLTTARRLPVRMILSGPAAGVSGATWVAANAGIADFITCDMGGTSTDVCLIEQLKAATVNETAFAGYPIKGREIAINTVASGGGSIAHVEAGDILKVGPRSAGACPGPACYGFGGLEPTVIDANVVLGRLGPRILGGSILPDPQKARIALASLAERIGVPSAEAAAEGVVRLAVSQMASAIREITIERGHDPARFMLVAFGGAGPMHATQIADEIGMPEVLIPILPGNLSALGLLVSDQRYDRVRTHFATLSALDHDALRAALAEHLRLGRAELAERGFVESAMRFEHALDMRYARQGFELTVDLPEGDLRPETLRRIFLDSYARKYGRADPQRAIEIVNLRTASIGISEKPQIPLVRGASGTLAGAQVAERRIVARGAALQAAVYERDRLPVEVDFEGPAIIEEDGATTVVLTAWRVRRDRYGNLRLTTMS